MAIIEYKMHDKCNKNRNPKKMMAIDFVEEKMNKIKLEASIFYEMTIQ